LSVFNPPSRQSPPWAEDGGMKAKTANATSAIIARTAQHRMTLIMTLT
jgi:hypothetical protein